MLYTAIFLLLVLILVVIIFLLLKIKVVIEFIRNGYDDHFVISFFILNGLVKRKFEIPLIDIETEGIKFVKYKEKGKENNVAGKDTGKVNFMGIYEKIKAVWKFNKEHKQIICDIKDYLWGKFSIKELSLDITIGTGDAYFTGILSGYAWMAAGILVSYLSNNIKTYKKHVNIKSDFDSQRLNVDLFCIFSLRIAHIIVVGIKIKMRNKKSLKTKDMIGSDVSG